MRWKEPKPRELDEKHRRRKCKRRNGHPRNGREAIAPSNDQEQPDRTTPNTCARRYVTCAATQHTHNSSGKDSSKHQSQCTKNTTVYTDDSPDTCGEIPFWKFHHIDWDISNATFAIIFEIVQSSPAKFLRLSRLNDIWRNTHVQP